VFVQVVIFLVVTRCTDVVVSYISTGCRNPEDHNLNLRGRENFNSRIDFPWFALHSGDLCSPMLMGHSCD